MRKLALSGAVLLFALTGCGARAPVKPVDETAIFVAAWHSRFPNGSAADAVQVGKNICADYEAGTSFRDEVDYLMVLAPSMTAGDAGFMIGNATSTFCPKYSNRH